MRERTEHPELVVQLGAVVAGTKNSAVTVGFRIFTVDGR